MPRIPIYQSQRGPNQAAGGGRASAAYAGEGLASLGQGAARIGQAMAINEERLQRREDEDARLWANTAGAQAEPAYAEMFTTLQTESPAGADDFTDVWKTRTAEYRAEAMKNAPSETARKYLGIHFESMDARYNSGAIKHQAASRIKWRSDGLKEATDLDAKTVYANPELFGEKLGKQLGEIYATEGMDQETKANLKEYTRGELAKWAARGAIDKNPAGWKPEGSTWNIMTAAEQQATRDYAAHKVNQLETERRQREAEVKAKQAESREILRQRVADQTAMAYDGMTVKSPITRAEFAAAGVADDYEAYKDTLRMGPDFAALAGMSPTETAAFLASKKPAAEEGYARETKQYDALRVAAANIDKERQTDPVTFSARHGTASVGPLNPADPEAFSAELRNRAVLSRANRETFGAPAALLSAPEAEQFAQTLNGMTAVEKAGLLQQIRQATPDDGSYHTVMAQLRPDSPVTALAGSMLAKDQRASSVAMLVLQGEDLLNPTKATQVQNGKPRMAMPKEGLLRETWAAYTGDAYRGAPDAHDVAYQAYRAFYAASAAKVGKYDGEIDDDIAEQAAEAVTGGVMGVGGKNIVLPFGMDEDTARDRLAKAWRAARHSAGYGDGVSLDVINLQTEADGVYLVTAGNGPLKDKQGRPIYLRIGGQK